MLENWDGNKREMKSGEATTRSAHESLRFIAHNFPLRHRHCLCYNCELVVIITDRCSYYYFYYI